MIVSSYCYSAEFSSQFKAVQRHSQERSCASASRPRSRTTSSESPSPPPVSPSWPTAATRCSSRPAQATARRSPTPTSRRAGAQIDQQRRRGVGRGRSAAQGQGADRGRVQPHARGPDAVHLPAPGRLQAVHRRAAGLGHHVDRLRNRADRRRRAAPAGPDERGRRPACPRRSARTT